MTSKEDKNEEHLAILDQRQPPKKKESFCGIFCCSNKIVALKSIFKRRPSSLEPLDGVRAIAVTMIVFMHTALFINTNWITCLKQSNFFNIYARTLANGGIGVDIFFTLSGFLIGYILFREIEKYGAIDILNFYRSRFLRIWPGMAACVSTYIHSIPNLIAILLFIDNLVDLNTNWEVETHLWSIMVEFQFYMVSPFIVTWMSKSKKPWLAPLILFIIQFVSTLVSFILTCPNLIKPNGVDPVTHERFGT